MSLRLQKIKYTTWVIPYLLFIGRYSLGVIKLNEIYIHDTKKEQKGKDPNRTLRPMMGAHTRDIQ